MWACVTVPGLCGVDTRTLGLLLTVGILPAELYIPSQLEGFGSWDVHERENLVAGHLTFRYSSEPIDRMQLS